MKNNILKIDGQQSFYGACRTIVTNGRVSLATSERFAKTTFSLVQKSVYVKTLWTCRPPQLSGNIRAISRSLPLLSKSDTNSPIRALEILEFLASEGPVGHTFISEHLAIPKSTASSLLKSLTTAGYVLRGDDRRFMLAPRVLRLSEGFLIQRQWLQPLLPLLEHLRDQTNETTFLLERRGNSRVVIERRLVGEGLSFTVPVGDIAPLAGTAGGHALCNPDEFPLDAHGKPEPVERNAENVYFAPSAIVPGVSSFAVAVRVPEHIPPLAFSLAMPDVRLTPEIRLGIEAALLGVRDAAERILGTATS